MSEEIRRRS